MRSLSLYSRLTLFNCGGRAVSLGTRRAILYGDRVAQLETVVMTNFDVGAAAGRGPRPISPHIQVYRFMLTYLMSGLHRITGFFLYFGFALVVWWLVAAATGPNAYAAFQWFIGSHIWERPPLRSTLALSSHMLRG